MTVTSATSRPPAGGGQSTPPGDLSQSERDWAFAKRALARGDDPEEVIRRIADYRGDRRSTPKLRAAHGREGQGCTRFRGDKDGE